MRGTFPGSGGTLNAQPGSQAITPRDHTRPKAAAAGQRHFGMKMKMIVTAAALAASICSAAPLDVDTVSYVKTTLPVSATEAVEAVLGDVDEFVGDAEARIGRLHKAALSHRGSAMVYSAASHRLAAEGDCTGSSALRAVSDEFLALARVEEATAAVVSELLSAVTEYDTVRRIGADPCGITAPLGAVCARVEDAIAAERRVNAASTVVESLVEKTKDSLKLGLGLLKADKDK